MPANLGSPQFAIGSGGNDDRVFGAAVHGYQSGAGECFRRGGDADGINALHAQTFAICLSLLISTDAADKGDAGALTRCRDRLVSALASTTAEKRVSGQSFPWRRQPFNTRNVIE